VPGLAHLLAAMIWGRMPGLQDENRIIRTFFMPGRSIFRIGTFIGIKYY